MKKSLLLAALMLPLPLAAQVRPSLGVGGGLLQTDDLVGRGYHVQAAVQVARISEQVTVRGEALYQQGKGTGSPFACEQARQFYCLGRSDEQRLMGGGAHLRIDLPEFRRGVHAYLTPVGVGVYHLRTDSREWEGPTGMCIVDNQITSCPDNPPFTNFSRTITTTSLGWTTGAGVEAEVGRMRVFAEVRAHDMLFPGGQAGAVPLTVGVSF